MLHMPFVFTECSAGPHVRFCFAATGVRLFWPFVWPAHTAPRQASLLGINRFVWSHRTLANAEQASIRG